MIQRIQSLFLLGIVVISIVLFFVPLAEYSSGTIQLFISGISIPKEINGIEVPNLLLLLLVNCTIGIGAIITILLFSKRSLQVTVSRFLLLLNTFFIVLIFYYSDLFEKRLTGVVVDYQMGAILPLISMIFLFMAIQSIRKDEALVKSADRLRD